MNTIGGNGGSGCMGERVTKGGEPVNNQGVWNVGGIWLNGCMVSQCLVPSMEKRVIFGLVIFTLNFSVKRSPAISMVGFLFFKGYRACQ
jgi:hypothetical protein